jgi:hypothetical protein
MTKANTWQSIFEAFDKADKSLALCEADIQWALVRGLVKWKEDGDYKSMMKLADKVPFMKSKGIRKNALIGWFEEVCGWTYDPKAKAWDANKKKKYEGDTIGVKKWWDCSPEPEYKPIDEVKAIEALITKLTKRIEAGVKDGDVVHMDTVTKLREVVSDIKNAA